jgi:hypothetical protein
MLERGLHSLFLQLPRGGLLDVQCLVVLLDELIFLA